MRPYSEVVVPGEPDPSREVAAEILRRHRNEKKSPSILGLLGSFLSKIWRSMPQKPEPPQWPLAGIRQPLGRGPRPRSGAVAMKEP
jgi:hypothetical protein